MTLFSSLNLQDALLDNLATLDYVSMTPIQAKSLPVMLENQDVIAQAKTGSGKTVAFGLALLNSLDVQKYAVQALVLCPTRELADQVAMVIRQLARMIPNIKVLNLSGGVPMRAQNDSLRHGAHIIVGTPGRVQKHLKQETLLLDNLKTLVLDEADRMLDMGFYDDIHTIAKACPIKRQTLLFSATYPAEIETISKKILNNARRVQVQEQEKGVSIKQAFYELAHSKDKLDALKKLLVHYRPDSTIVFCNTKEQTNKIAKSLSQAGFGAMALNGDMEQADRDQVMIQFKNGSCPILVATDVAARGLDIKELPVVINYDLAFEYDVHIHRIGRTGRAGHQGLAVSLTLPSDAERLCIIQDRLGQTIPWAKLDEMNSRQDESYQAEMQTLCLDAGKKDKIRPGDILGALTKDAGLSSEVIGKIDITPYYSYVAVKHNFARVALKHFQTGKLKGRRVSSRELN